MRPLSSPPQFGSTCVYHVPLANDPLSCVRFLNALNEWRQQQKGKPGDDFVLQELLIEDDNGELWGAIYGVSTSEPADKGIVEKLKRFFGADITIEQVEEPCIEDQPGKPKPLTREKREEVLSFRMQALYESLVASIAARKANKRVH
jgi:hypothetical protein